MNILQKYFALIFALSFSFLTFSQNNGTHDDKSLSPYFMVKSDNPDADQLPLKNTYADVNIVGVIADVKINQVYKNEGSSTLEAIYTFPASSMAAVYAMEMMVGDRKIVAKIEEKEVAKKNYEEAKAAGKRASLLEQKRPNVFEMNVANILPGDEITVTLKYTEMLVPTDGKYEFVYPTVVGPRYNAQSEDIASASGGGIIGGTKIPYQKENEESSYDFDINICLAAGVPIQNVECPSHDIEVEYENLDQARINLDASEKKGGNRDVVLEYKLAGDEINSGMLLYEHDDEKFFMMMVQPPKRIVKEDIPPREYIFINDVSGSMKGYPMDVSKKIMRNLVTSLRPEDRFNVLVFAGTSGWLSDESLPATNENLTRAVNFIDTQKGSGGTEIMHAMTKALSFPKAYEEMSRSFVVVTDGYVSVEKEVFDLIKNNNDKANTFVFGIGSSVNRYLLEGMAHVGMGEPFIVLDKEQADEKADKFRAYITNPVLTQVKPTFIGFDVYDVEPATVPDVFAERPIVIYGKYRGEPKGTVKLTGYSGRKKWKSTMDVGSVVPNNDNEALRYLWARKKIQMLDDYASVNAPSKEEVTTLGLKYNLLTKYTSFVAIEEQISSDGKVIQVKQPLPLPQNVSNSAVGAEMVAYCFSMKKSVATNAQPDRIQLNEIVMKPDNKSSRRTNSSEEDFKIETYIQDILLSQLDEIRSANGNLEKIKIEVDKNGKVEKVKVFGRKLTPALEKEVEDIVSKWNFAHLNILKPWTYKVYL